MKNNMYYCSIKDIPKYRDIKMFCSFRIKATEDVYFELRTSNIPNIREAICVYKHIKDDVELLFSGRLNENNYDSAMRVLKDYYYQERIWKDIEEKDRLKEDK